MVQVNNTVYFDDNCPLCIRTIKFLKRWVSPVKTEFLALSDSGLEQSISSRAYSEMLLVVPGPRYYWGYETYAMLMKLSSKPYRLMLVMLSKLMLSPGIMNIGIRVYSRIANGRLRCSSDASCATE